MEKIIRTVLLIFLLILWKANAYSTTKGPIIIDIIGYDSISNIIYFTQTNWAECDCETDLYKYHVSIDSLEIVSNWAKRTNFSKNKTEVIKEKGLDYLIPINIPTVEKTIYSFAWLPVNAYYSNVLMKDTIECSFQISVGNRIYKYVQCYSQNNLPIVKEFEIKVDFGLVTVNYNGECMEGNTIDKLIFYKRSSEGVESRELKVIVKL
jgi:hypothetical protein